MANAQTKLKLQHAHATNVLNYGHLGTASYIEHSKDWVFLRGRSGRAADCIVTTDQSAICPAFPFARVGDDTPDVPHLSAIDADNAGVEAGIWSNHTFSRLFPETLPETGHHQQGHNAASERDDVAAESLLQQSQLAFGGAAAVLENGRSGGTVPIAAIVTGKNFEKVKILRIVRESIQLNDTSGMYARGRNYQIPKIDYDEEGCWDGNGDAVQQICFAAACDYETTRSAWLAARCRSSTTVFHPLFRKSRLKDDNSDSRLAPNPVLSIPISRTGGHPHADIAFHPQDRRILAAVDGHGNWSIWKIEGRHPIRGRVLFVAHLQSSGRLFPDKKGLFMPDDWHSICWMSRTTHEADRLLVSNRSHTAIFDLTGSNLGELDMRSGSTTEGQTILDVMKSATNPTHFYVLTSTKILLMSAGEEDLTDPRGHQQMAMILAWSHYRDRSDSSLRMILLEAAQGMINGPRRRSDS